MPKSPQVVSGKIRRLEVDVGSLLYQVGSDWHTKVTPRSTGNEWEKIPVLTGYLPSELRTISSPPPPSWPITRHHLHLPPLSVTPRAFHSKLKSHLFNHSYPDPSDHSPSPS